MLNNRIDTLINNYSLLAHPEGGFYSETYRGALELNKRSNATSIYFLLDRKNVSHFHSIKSDELWFHHEGDALKIHMISPEGKYSFALLGKNIENNEQHQVLVPAHFIFGSEVISSENDFAFVGCVVSPGFDFEDFQLYTNEEIVQLIPEQVELANRLT